MGRFRSLLWLVVLMGFIAPSFGAAPLAHAGHPAEAPALADCPEHTPPDPCPDKGTAKHAAGDCCPLMAVSFALLPPAAAGLDRAAAFDVLPPTRARVLAGRTFAEDPPPPRV